MVWCSHCGKDQPTERDDINGYVCCIGCGRVVDDTIFSSDPTFIKTAGGESQLAGNFVREGKYTGYGRLSGNSDEYGYRTDSHERTLERGREEIEIIAESLSISGREDAVNASHRLYVLAVERNFTKGRRVKQVAAACLYIVCRQDQKPFLLIDFSDVLQINVYVLGAVFLQLCKLMRLEQHPIVQKPVDPSLFIHRFADRLVGRSTTRKQFHSIVNSALRILMSMKRDWLQTGRKPSGLCGAALYIAAHAHRINCTKTEVVSVVHICENTLTKRLIEFEDTESGSLTIEEFESRAKELEAEMQSFRPLNKIQDNSVIPELLCEHKDLGVAHFAHGLCRACYEEIVKISGGLHGGSNPPAFERAEQKRKEEMCKKQNETASKDIEVEEHLVKDGADTCWNSEYSKNISKDGYSKGDYLETAEVTNWDDQSQEDEKWSDIDDDEVERYLHNEEEVRLKTIIWTQMNKEYLEEQAAKEAAIAAAEAAQAAAMEAALKGAPDAVELAAAAAAAVAKLKKDKQRKRLEEAKNKVPAQSAAEATHQMLTKKKLSSKVNYEVLESLFEENKKKEDSNVTENSDQQLNSQSEKRTLPGEEDDTARSNRKRQAIGIDTGQKAGPVLDETDRKVDDELDDEYAHNAGQDGINDDAVPPSYGLQYEDDYEYDYEEY
eukprot:TRINITY_DN8639_c0_g1_i1.p1 TRINITY_DN8639_c0_g1~~TRINITY_DN8639_c0_g1_i1.p1  ORF type:complete len:666 (+),score=178.80 TRINITY_DN8639_c0_g1_i1:307-2304(+)